MSLSAQVGELGRETLQQVSKVLGSSDTPAGLFVSPLSLYVALVLTLNGAGPESATYNQIWAALQQGKSADKADSQDDPVPRSEFNKQVAELHQLLRGLNSGEGTEVLIASAVWTNKTPVNPEYATAMSELFQAPVNAAKSAADINAWAARATKGLISQVIPPGTPFDLVLTNAVYFKGRWEHPFKTAATSCKLFNTHQNQAVQVPMMSGTFNSGPGGRTRPVRYAELSSPSSGAAFRGVRLPYHGSSTSAIALLPAATTSSSGGGAAEAGGQQCTSDLGGGAADSLLGFSGLDLKEVLADATWRQAPKLELELPQFKIKNDLVLSKALQAQGIMDAFIPGSADLSGLSSTRLHVSDVLQSVFVQVDEEGTEAAAATAVVMMRSMALPQEPVRLTFDRPFVFLVVEDTTGVVLFMGQVLDPSRAPV